MIDNWVKLNAKYSHRFSNRLITRTRKIKLCLVIRKRRFATIFECKWLWSISLSKSEEQTGVGGGGYPQYLPTMEWISKGDRWILFGLMMSLSPRLISNYQSNYNRKAWRWDLDTQIGLSIIYLSYFSLRARKDCTRN